MEEERRRLLDEIAAYVAHDEQGKAKVASGQLAAMVGILASLDRPEAVPEPVEVPFVDPAEIIPPERMRP